MRKLYLRRGYRPLWRQLRGVYDSRRGFKKRMRRRRVYKKLSHYLARRCSSLIPFIPYTFRRKPRKLTKRRRKLAQRKRMRTLRALSRGKRRVGYASRFIFHKQFSTRAYCFDFNRKLNRVLVKRRRAGKKRNRILRVYRPQLRRLSSSIFRLSINLPTLAPSGHRIVSFGQSTVGLRPSITARRIANPELLAAIGARRMPCKVAMRTKRVYSSRSFVGKLRTVQWRRRNLPKHRAARVRRALAYYYKSTRALRVARTRTRYHTQLQKLCTMHIPLVRNSQVAR